MSVESRERSVWVLGEEGERQPETRGNAWGFGVTLQVPESLDFSVVQWLGLCASTAGGMGSVPGQGTRIPTCCVAWAPPTKKDPRSSVRMNFSAHIQVVKMVNVRGVMPLARMLILILIRSSPQREGGHPFRGIFRPTTDERLGNTASRSLSNTHGQEGRS